MNTANTNSRFLLIRDRYLKKRAILLFLIFVISIAVSSCTNINRTIVENKVQNPTAGKGHINIMLVLGSADPATRAIRIDLACSLLKKGDIRFDRIILSGGCGAHGTDDSNCEATDMKRLLEAGFKDGISGVEVYKEESSGSTIQNYCFSRKMQKDGKSLIEKGDTLYVVSSHYHALSVAACFNNNGVNAHYYYTCSGNLYDGSPPSLETIAASSDPCFKDYAGIAQNCGSVDWCEHQSMP